MHIYDSTVRCEKRSVYKYEICVGVQEWEQREILMCVFKNSHILIKSIFMNKLYTSLYHHIIPNRKNIDACGAT